MTEVVEEITLPKVKNTPNPGGISVELLKCAPEIVLENVWSPICVKCTLQGENPPNEWKFPSLHQFLKRGQKLMLKCNSKTATVVKHYGGVIKEKFRQNINIVE